MAMVPNCTCKTSKKKAKTRGAGPKKVTAIDPNCPVHGTKTVEGTALSPRAAERCLERQAAREAAPYSRK